MLYTQQFSFPVRLPGGLKWLLLAWMVAELAAFAVVVHIIGLGGAVVLGLFTTIVGIVMLRRIGTDAARSLRRAMEGREPAPTGALLDGMLAALGAILLILPGFVSNFVGFALASPSVRNWAMARFDGQDRAPPGARFAKPARPDVIDLTPEDWRSVDKR